MSTTRRSIAENLPEGLKPRLRVFLSVDLVGSTSFKQRHAWRPEILSFYRDFDYILFKNYSEFGRSLDGALSAPEFWKSNGDELLYTWELTNLSHAHAIMHIWLASLREYRALDPQRPQHLDVKSTAWIALFPVPNAEIFFRRGARQAGEPDARDPVLLQAELREDWYANGASPDVTKEYVGPSIDTGFRLTAWAQPSRMMLSVDLAFLLTSLPTADLDGLALRLGGKEKLKGVIDNEPYPMIWAPVGARGATAGASADNGLIRSACEAVIERHHKFIPPIFLSFGPMDTYEWAPPYILKQVTAHWREEEDYRRLKAPAVEAPPLRAVG